MLRFRVLGASFSSLGCFVFEFWVLRFRSWVLRFRVLGASFSSFGCFVLRSSFSSASFSKLPLSDNNTALNPNKLDKMDRISPPEPGTFGNRVTDNARMVTTISGIVEAE